jgi:hypothetical protein
MAVRGDLTRVASGDEALLAVVRPDDGFDAEVS